RAVGGIGSGDVSEGHAAKFGAEAGRQRNEVHRHILHSFVGRISPKTSRLARKAGRFTRSTALRVVQSVTRVRQPQKRDRSGRSRGQRGGHWVGSQAGKCSKICCSGSHITR